jgi:FAD:protein FMN transferase
MLLHSQTIRLMGNRFQIGVVCDDATEAHESIEEAIQEIRRIEALLTTFDDQSQTNRINAQAGIAPVKVEQEVFELVNAHYGFLKSPKGHLI